MSKQPIKRGLADLIMENRIPDLEKEEVIDILLDDIKPNPFQPRKHFDEAALQELADSIKINGVLQPVIVKRVGGGYLLVAGERRCKASKIAGFLSVPAIVRDYNDQYLAELSLLENIQREDLTIIEEAYAYQLAIDSLKLTHLELAQKIGKSRSYVSNILGILTLPSEVIDEINRGNITMGHARALSKLEDTGRIHKIAAMIVTNKLSVRDIEAMMKKEKKKRAIHRKDVDSELINKLSELKIKLDHMTDNKYLIKARQNQIIISFKNAVEVDTFKEHLKDK